VSAGSDHDTALVRLSWKQSRARIAALRDTFARVEKQAAFSFASSNGVTFEAVLGEEGANARFKKGDVRFRGFRGRGKRCTEEESSDEWERNLHGVLLWGIRFDATEFVPPRMVIRLCGISRINLMVRGVLGRGS
jgi:hypothetical protein